LEPGTWRPGQATDTHVSSHLTDMAQKGTAAAQSQLPQGMHVAKDLSLSAGQMQTQVPKSGMQSRAAQQLMQQRQALLAHDRFLLPDAAIQATGT